MECLEQFCPVELFVKMKIFKCYAVEYSSHWSYVTTEHLKNGLVFEKLNFKFNFILIKEPQMSSGYSIG